MKQNLNNINIDEFRPIFNVLEEQFIEYDLLAFDILKKIEENILNKIEKGN